MTRLGTIKADVSDALERVNVPSYAYDKHGIIRWINRAGHKLMGDIRGRQITSIVAPEETRRAREAYARHMVGHEDVEASAVILDGEGNRVTVEVKPEALVHPHLTPRQAEVLRLLEHGRSTEQIASELHLSLETVRNHIRGILRALGVHSRLEAVAVARRERVVTG